MQSDDDSHDARTELLPGLERELAEMHGGVRRFLLRSLRSEADADDVMQDFYVKVLRRSFQLAREDSARAWLRRVLQNVLRDHLRRQSAQQRAEADFARKEAATGLSEHDFDMQACLCIYKALPAMKPEHAEVLRRVELAEEPRTAVAAALGITMGNLSVRLFRARRSLQQILELSCETCPVHGYLDCGCEYMKRLRGVRSEEVEDR